MPSPPSSLDAWVRRQLKREPPRSKSLIITLFGDLLLPHLPGILLSDLTTLLQPFGVNAQLVRTSCFRLAAEGWLESQREGRTSRYALTESGRQRIEQACRRIYAPPETLWSGDWTILIPTRPHPAGRRQIQLRRELEWAGFGRLAPRLFLHPTADPGGLGAILSRCGLAPDILTLQAHRIPGFPSTSLNSLVAECWDLNRVAAHYQTFRKHCQPLASRLEAVPPPSPQTAFLAQTLLVHLFRRVVLHDPRLPPELLPRNWPGAAAYDLCRAVYRRTRRQALTHLVGTLNLPPANRPHAAPLYLDRFR